MRGFARWMTVVLAGIVALGAALPAVAQDDDVGFEDMTGIQQAVTRSFGSPDDRDVLAGVETPRDLHKPMVVMLLTAVYRFDTEANAAASFALLKTDVNATGFSGQPLDMTPVTLPIGLEHAVAVGTDAAFGEDYNFVLATALDGPFIYSVIGITTGGAPKAAVASTLNVMASGAAGSEAGTLDPAGGSSGGIWGKVPTLAMVELEFRGVASVEDAAPFPA